MWVRNRYTGPGGGLYTGPGGGAYTGSGGRPSICIISPHYAKRAAQIPVYPKQSRPL